MEPIRCLLNSSVRNALTVNEYKLKSGKHITEMITDYGNDNKVIREIHKDLLGYPEKIVDNVFGTIETFYPGKVGVIRELNGVKTEMPDTTMEMLTRA